MGIQGSEQQLSLLRVQEDLSEARHHFGVLVRARCDRNACPHLLPVPLDPIRELEEGDGGVLDISAARVGPVREGEPFAYVGGQRLLSVMHRNHVSRLDGTDLHEHVTCLLNSLGAGGRPEPQPHAFLRQQRSTHQFVNVPPSRTARSSLSKAGSPMNMLNARTTLSGACWRARASKPT